MRRTPFNYRDWLARAKQFVLAMRAKADPETFSCEIAPPVKPKDCSALDRRLRIRIPDSVRDFLTQGSGNCNCHVNWRPDTPEVQDALKKACKNRSYYGGARLCDFEQLRNWQEGCRSDAENTWIVDELKVQKVWLRAFPFASIDNGDYLAVDPGPAGKSKHVVYLNHEGLPKKIAPSFDAFLAAWESVYYVGPEWWLLYEFCHRETGYLHGKSRRAAQLGKLLLA
jgi:hypothetical protein